MKPFRFTCVDKYRPNKNHLSSFGYIPRFCINTVPHPWSFLQFHRMIVLACAIFFGSLGLRIVQGNIVNSVSNSPQSVVRHISVVWYLH